MFRYVAKYVGKASAFQGLPSTHSDFRPNAVQVREKLSRQLKTGQPEMALTLQGRSHIFTNAFTKPVKVCTKN